jgi:hypothetical protein
MGERGHQGVVGADVGVRDGGEEHERVREGDWVGREQVEDVVGEGCGGRERGGGHSKPTRPGHGRR